MTIKENALSIAAVIAVVLCGYFYAKSLRTELTAAKQSAEEVKRTAEQLQGVANRLNGSLDKWQRHQTQLEQAYDDVNKARATRANEQNRLEHDDPTFRDWSSVRLPASAQRLYASPALTGARDFVAAVPEGDALHPASAAAAD